MSASMMYNGRLLGGLSFQDSNSYCIGGLNSNQLLEDGDFIFAIFTIRKLGTSSLLRRDRENDTIDQAYQIFKQDGGLTFRCENSNGGLRGQFVPISPNLKVGDRLLFGVNINSAINYDYVVSIYTRNILNVVMNSPISGNTGIIPFPDRFIIGYPSVESEIIHTIGLLHGSLTEQELYEFAASEAMRIPSGKTIKYLYDFRESGGTTLKDRGSGAIDLTLTNFLSTVQGNLNNRWVHPYKLTPR